MGILKKIFKPKAVEKKKTTPNRLEMLLADAVWLLAVLALIYIALCLASFSILDPAWSRSTTSTSISNLGGVFGAYFSDILYYIFGLSCWWIMFALLVCLIKTYRSLSTPIDKATYSFGYCTLGAVLLLISSPTVERLLWQEELASLPMGAGGGLGSVLLTMLGQTIGTTGTILFSMVLALIGFSLIVQISWLDLVEKIGAKLEAPFEKKQSTVATTEQKSSVSSFIKTKIIQKTFPTPTEDKPEPTHKKTTKGKKSKLEINSAQPSLFEEDNPPVVTNSSKPKISSSSGLPNTDLLQVNTQGEVITDPEKLQTTAKLITDKLAEFGVGVQVVGATAGPVITRYEIEPNQGVKGTQIVNLGKDLARALSLQTIRIVETIAGKSSMGLELPNEQRQTVYLSDLFKAKVFQNSHSCLTLALGKDIAGSPLVADLAKMPHLLVAGTTGSGKSVAINTMIISILYKATPDDVRLIMVDPKMLELSIYQDIPHLLTPVVTDMKLAANALNWCVREMDKRYRLLSHVGVRNLSSFNEKIKEAQKAGLPITNPFSLNAEEPEPLATLPQIVIIVDEFADLMMVEGKKVEQLIARLAQKARAAGIHLILATQRPSVDVITGLIKANIPTRISFQVSSKIDSRTILDQMGAESLLGSGDMLFLPPGTGTPTRIHGAFVSDEDVHNVVSYLKAQGTPHYIDDITEQVDETSTNTATSQNERGEDELFDEAVAFILESRKTSISSLQRHLRIGYNRAANLMESLEKAGVVSAPELGGSRKILAQKTRE
ncbi:DNA translocase FtsK [Neisseria sp. Ec49-e6-T10]|uniref:DNA translocase FtsK n=1 Tax=Neisseria sp. Ec49-e6-T10 TaxID=3140744 RepID=UPI003EBC1F3B